MTLQPCKTNRQNPYETGDRVFFFDYYHYLSADKMKLATVTRDQCGPDVSILVDGEEGFGEQWGVESSRRVKVSTLFDIYDDDKIGEVETLTAPIIERVAAVAAEKGIGIAAAGEQVEDFIARHDNPANWVEVAADGSWSMPTAQPIAVAEVAVETVAVAEVETLTEEEIKSAKKVKKILAADPLNVQIFRYIIQNQPIGSVGFCQTAGIDTRTMQARARAIRSAVKDSLKNETVASHLARIMGVKTVTAGGWLKAR